VSSEVYVTYTYRRQGERRWGRAPDAAVQQKRVVAAGVVEAREDDARAQEKQEHKEQEQVMRINEA